MTAEELRALAKRLVDEAAGDEVPASARFGEKLAVLFGRAAECIEDRPDAFEVGVQRRSLLMNVQGLAEATEALYEGGAS